MKFIDANVVKLCFNTQPPEGGWEVDTGKVVSWQGFNTQPPEGGWFCCLPN